MNNNKEKKSGKGWGALAFILILFLSRLFQEGNLSRGSLGVLFLAGMIAVGVGLVFFIAAAARKKGSSAGTSSASVRQSPSVPLSRPVPSMQRREPVTAQRNFQKPDAYCITCENTGDDHFARDRANRIRQLDEWLKNGLIDKEEYRVLKHRFEHDQ